MTRASQICSTAGCGNLQPCPDHKREPWAGSNRSSRVVSGSRQAKRARFVINRDDGICHVCGRPGATEVDHVEPTAEGGADDVSNMAPIHPIPCHRDKTAAEAKRGREAASR